MNIKNKHLTEEVGCQKDSLHEAWEKNTELLDQYQEVVEHLYAYVPKKGDKIDCVLADYINSYPQRHLLKVLFLRISYGMYQFGKKKV